MAELLSSVSQLSNKFIQLHSTYPDLHISLCPTPLEQVYDDPSPFLSARPPSPRSHLDTLQSGLIRSRWRSPRTPAERPTCCLRVSQL